MILGDGIHTSQIRTHYLCSFVFSRFFFPASTSGLAIFLGGVLLFFFPVFPFLSFPLLMVFLLYCLRVSLTLLFVLLLFGWFAMCSFVPGTFDNSPATYDSSYILLSSFFDAFCIISRCMLHISRCILHLLVFVFRSLCGDGRNLFLSRKKKACGCAGCRWWVEITVYCEGHHTPAVVQ